MAANLLSTHYTAIAHMSNLLAELLLTTGLDLSDIQAAVENNLKQLLVKYFDPKMVDVYFFGDNVRDLPPWLETLIRYPQWRRLIYKLSEDYPDCVMLTFTIKVRKSCFLFRTNFRFFASSSPMQGIKAK